MKKLGLFTFLFLMLGTLGVTQNSVQLNIHHKLGNADFAMETGAKNNLDNDFNVTRLQYYISEISITHDGGIETTIEDLWVLVNAEEATAVDLGNHEITAVEKINFHVGVDSEHNHLDPASYHPAHPLAPKFPSMHWGWAAGYRFAAFEGNSGNNFSQVFQFHALGDNNYFNTEIPFSVEAANGEVIIDIDADYTRALEDINVSGGVIVHGDYEEAKLCLENFRDHVFSPSGVTSSTIDFSEVSNFEVYPNPVSNGNFTIALDATESLTYQVSITDVLGREIRHFSEVSSNSTLDVRLNESGFYFVNLIKEGQPVISKKLISK